MNISAQKITFVLDSFNYQNFNVSNLQDELLNSVTHLSVQLKDDLPTEAWPLAMNKLLKTFTRVNFIDTECKKNPKILANFTFRLSLLWLSAV